MAKKHKKKNIDFGRGVDLPPDFEFSEDFGKAYDLMENTDENLYISGNAGTGKSTLLEYFRQNTSKKFIILAPTGVAAIKVHGQTIHSFFKFPPRIVRPEHIKKIREKRLMRALDTVIIDEASMLRADLLDAVDYSLRKNRECYDTPFGGAQVILFGDLFQLSPVISGEETEAYFSRYETPYFFDAAVMRETGYKKIQLSRIYRQKDKGFINLLNRIRNRKINESDMESLNKRVDPYVEYGSGVITLTPTNRRASGINKNYLKKINGQEYVYSAEIEGNFDEKAAPAEVELRLKQGAQVMMLRNDPAGRWVNGTIGEVSRPEEDGVKVRIGPEVYDVPREKWEKIMYRYNEEKDRVEEEVSGSFSQYPVKLAWAITIHKSQGQTFDDVILDIDGGAFAHGQVYVALSRCRKIEGLKLKRPISYSDIIFDEKIYRFHENTI